MPEKIIPFDQRLIDLYEWETNPPTNLAGVWPWVKGFVIATGGIGLGIAGAQAIGTVVPEGEQIQVYNCPEGVSLVDTTRGIAIGKPVETSCQNGSVKKAIIEDSTQVIGTITGNLEITNSNQKPIFVDVPGSHLKDLVLKTSANQILVGTWGVNGDQIHSVNMLTGEITETYKGFNPSLSPDKSRFAYIKSRPLISLGEGNTATEQKC